MTVVENANQKDVMSGPAQSTIMSGVSDTEMLRDHTKSMDSDEEDEEEEEDPEELQEGDSTLDGKMKLPDWMESEEEATNRRFADLTVAVELLRAMREAAGRLSPEDLVVLLEAQGDLPAGPLRSELTTLLRAHVAATAAELPERRAETLYNAAVKWSLDIPGAGGKELAYMYMGDMERVGAKPDELLMQRVEEMSTS